MCYDLSTNKQLLESAIKQAMNIAHGKMESEFNTHKNPDLLVNRALNYNK